MRFLHISDLHLGKLISGYDISAEQKFMLSGICDIAENEKVDVVLIAGDVYDKPNPSADAMLLFSGFVSFFAEKNIPVYIISGNHDSAGRVSYFSGLIRDKGIYVTEKFTGSLQTYTVRDEYGEIDIHLLPFVKPLTVNEFFPDDKISTYEEAVAAVLENSTVDSSKRNILVCHQFITGSEKSGSEAMSVGGLENIPASLFDDFDYVAMGHIHGAQKAGRPEVRYCGSPMKYDISEANSVKTVTIADMDEKGSVKISTAEVPHLRDLIAVKGKFRELMQMSVSNDFVGVILTDEEIVPDAKMSLKNIFPYMISFGVENSKMRTVQSVEYSEQFISKSPLELFESFFMEQNGGTGMSKRQAKIMAEIFEQAEVTEN